MKKLNKLNILKKTLTYLKLCVLLWCEDLPCHHQST